MSCPRGARWTLGNPLRRKHRYRRNPRHASNQAARQTMGRPLRFKDRFGIRRWRGQSVTRLDREANNSDIEALIAFARSRVGVEFYVEPETFATDTTAVAV